MKKLSISLAILVMLVGGCGENKEITPEQKHQQIMKTKNAAQAYSAAVKRVKSNDPAGFLGLFEIASDDITYTVEYREVAYDELSILLYTDTATWVQTFASVDQAKFRKIFNGINDAQLPDGVSTSEQFFEGIKLKLKKIKGDTKERELVVYLLSLIEPNTAK